MRCVTGCCGYRHIVVFAQFELTVIIPTVSTTNCRIGIETMGCSRSLNIKFGIGNSCFIGILINTVCGCRLRLNRKITTIDCHVTSRINTISSRCSICCDSKLSIVDRRLWSGMCLLICCNLLLFHPHAICAGCCCANSISTTIDNRLCSNSITTISREHSRPNICICLSNLTSINSSLHICIISRLSILICSGIDIHSICCRSSPGSNGYVQVIQFGITGIVKAGPCSISIIGHICRIYTNTICRARSRSGDFYT